MVSFNPFAASREHQKGLLSDRIVLRLRVVNEGLQPDSIAP
jgi:hypothetical protein